MQRNFQVIDLIDSQSGQYLGQALYCATEEDCPLFTLKSRANAGEILEAFVEGAKQVGGDVNLYHVNMPIEINTHNTPYKEIRNTIVERMKIRTNSQLEKESSD